MNDDGNAKDQGRRGWYVALGGVGLVIVLIVLLLLVQRNTVERRLQALRAQGYPTSFAELAEQNQLPAGIRNAADTYTQAFAAFLPTADSVNTLFAGDANLPARGELLPEAVAQATERFLTDNQACLKWLREARAIEQCRYDWDYAQNMPSLRLIKQCTQLLSCAIVLRGYEGDTSAVLDYFADGRRLAGSLDNEPGLICYLVRVACTALNGVALERTLSVASFTDDQLVELDRLLADTAATLDLRRTLIGERCFMIECTRDPSLLGQGRARLWTIPGLAKFDLADVLDYMADCIEACELPRIERPERLRQINDALENLSFLHLGVKTLAPALGRVAALDVRCQGGTDLARTALAIERYRLATGSIPRDLESLVPDYLDHVPLDPYDGRPIRYQPTASGYRLYNVAEDGRDDGGLGKDEVPRGDPYDWPFIVAR